MLPAFVPSMLKDGSLNKIPVRLNKFNPTEAEIETELV